MDPVGRFGAATPSGPAGGPPGAAPDADRLRVQRRPAPLAPTFTTTNVKCDICSEMVPYGFLRKLVCEHIHCIRCLTDNVKVALKTDPFAPAKCCMVIPIEILSGRDVLTAFDFDEYKRKMDEYSGPITGLHCYDPACRFPIPEKNIAGRVGKCTKCAKNTCTACFQKSHFEPCNPDVIRALAWQQEQIRQMAKAQGWKYCPHCGQLIEKTGGCNHVIELTPTYIVGAHARKSSATNAETLRPTITAIKAMPLVGPKPLSS
ncbi:hypothetical protein AAE478_001960 [Parahypoxylon ruwenzoriense]